MLASVDSISLVSSFPKLRSEEIAELNFSKKKGKFGSWTWFDNGMPGIYEPQLTFYRTWNSIFRLRLDFNIPKLFYGSNVNLPSIEEIHESLFLVSNNLTERTGLKFDAFKADTCRIHYAFNQIYPVEDVKPVIGFFSRVTIPRMKTKPINGETVYYQNYSRGIRIYDKNAEVLNNNPQPELVEQSLGLIRCEYFINRLTPVKRFAKRLGFNGHTASEMLSERNINIAIEECKSLIGMENLKYMNDSKIEIIFKKTGNLNKAIQLSGFIDALRAFGEKFYKNEIYKMKKSTYYRLLGECHKLRV